LSPFCRHCFAISVSRVVMTVMRFWYCRSLSRWFFMSRIALSCAVILCALWELPMTAACRPAASSEVSRISMFWLHRFEEYVEGYRRMQDDVLRPRRRRLAKSSTSRFFPLGADHFSHLYTLNSIIRTFSETTQDQNTRASRGRRVESS
jgi:hypothetical protein